MLVFNFKILAYYLRALDSKRLVYLHIPTTLHRRSYFYIGSEYISTRNSVVSSGQMYVEHLVPIKVIQPFRIVFIPGNGMTGTNFLNTPDGRLGWADYFLSQGYELYIVVNL